MEVVLVVNPGSSSRKYALFREGQAVLELSFEGSDIGYEVCIQKKGAQQTCESISQADFQACFMKVATMVREYCELETVPLSSIVIRVVAPGTPFQKHSRIDDKYISLLRDKEQESALHIPAILREIQSCKEQFKDTPLIAASDSAFHATLPTVAREFAIRREDAAELDIHRFGYHGLSVASVVNRIHAVTGKDSARIVVCHVGSGVSVTAVKNGASIETSMGYSPVSGIPMGTRASDLDPGALLEIIRRRNMRPSETTVYINTSGGLAGLAGDGDIRRLLDRRSKGDMAATLALDLFVYRIQKEIVAGTVSLQGIDALVLTGTAALRSPELRTLITAGLQYMDLELDNGRNDTLIGKEGTISSRASGIKVVVMRTDEMGEMARIADSF